MSDDKRSDPADHRDHQGTNDHDERPEPASGKHKEKGSGPSDAVAPADDEIIIK